MVKRYSHSKLSTFEQCPIKFKYKYIDKIPVEFKKTIEAHNKFLIFTTECEKDCDFSLAVINAIEITPIVDKGSPLDDLKKGSFSLSSEEELCGSRRTTGILFI